MNYNQILENEILVGIDKIYHLILSERTDLTDETQSAKNAIIRITQELKHTINGYIDQTSNNSADYLENVDQMVDKSRPGVISINIPDEQH